MYNLTVEGDHEFFANGVLVHNCDCVAFGGYVMGADLILQSYLSGDLITDSSDYPSDDDVVKLTLAGGEVIDVDFSGDE